MDRNKKDESDLLKLRNNIREIIEEISEDLKERMLSFPDKTMMPMYGKDYLPYHAPVTTNKVHSHSKKKKKKKK